MSEENKLDPGTFDLLELVDERITYPRYTAKVHLDMEASRQIRDIDRQVKKNEKEYEEAMKKLENGSSESSLVDSSATDAKKLQQNIVALRSERQALEDQYQGSEISFVFSMTGKRVKYSDIRDKVREQVPAISSLNEEELQEHMRENPDTSETWAIETVMATLVEVKDSKGRKAKLEAVSRDQIKTMISRLSESSKAKIFRNANLALVGGQELDSQVDAGFPG